MFKREAGLSGAFHSFFNRKYEIFHDIKDISVQIEDGEILGILGENGAGKTTLIKLLVGLLHPSSGEVNINGFTPWNRKSDFLKQISVVMGQKNQLWWDIPASESFLLNQKIYEIPEIQYKNTLDELVDLLSVREKLNVQVRRLSLGERMKMEFIAALLHKPKIVLLDEPTIGLDVISQLKIREFVKYYNEKYKTTFLLTSHYMHDIQALCKRVFVIHKGASLYDGDFNDLVNRVNPKRKLLFEFNEIPDQSKTERLSENYNFRLDDTILYAELPDKELTKLVSELFQLGVPASITMEDLPVEDTMRSFFKDPEKFLK
ncbi:MAG: ATP-binding cassette domain-containing protein [Candidatus Marinimicrobia bacterium]|nr:ATP-binding cassette domain-containing protein [Candidatus Neomarinimicrobiota bacterium]